MNQKEQERRIQMMKAALPYSAGVSHQAMEILLQIQTLHSLAQTPPTSDLSACNTASQPEELLQHVQPFCTPREADMVQMILNFIKADHIFRNYREFSKTHPTEGHDLSAAEDPSSQLMEFLMTQLPPDQKIF